MLSKLSIHIGHRALPVPIWVCHYGPHFHPAQRAGRCNICSKPNWSIKISAEKKPKTQGANWEANWQRKGIWICFTFPACRSACLHVALHVQSWYHNENRWNSLANRKMQLCSPKNFQSVGANTVSAWKKIKPHSHPPKKKQRTFIPVILIISDIWHKVWTYTSATSKKKLTFLLAFIPSLQATQLIDGVMKNDSHRVHQQRIQWRFFGLLKKRSKNSWS